MLPTLIVSQIGWGEVSGEKIIPYYDVALRCIESVESAGPPP